MAAEKPWLAPYPGKAAAMSARLSDAGTTRLNTPSTYTCTSVESALSGSSAQPATLTAPVAGCTTSRDPIGWFDTVTARQPSHVLAPAPTFSAATHALYVPAGAATTRS